MEDQSGKLIDGTARARHWRGARPRSADEDGIETRSEAPKSIASSLLVPAEMLDPVVPPRSPADGLVSVTSEAPGHVNPFLAPEAFTTGNGRTAGRRTGPWGRAARRWLPPAGNGRRQSRSTVAIALGLAAVAAAAIVIPGWGESGSSRGVLAESIGASGPLGVIEQASARPFASNPFREIKSTSPSRSKDSARTGPHRSHADASRTRRAVRRPMIRAGSQRRHDMVIADEHTSTASPVTRVVTPQVETAPSQTSTATPPPSPVSEHSSNSGAGAQPAANSRRPAFGSNGLLGPGSSPDS
jgi:hypothetical protein